MNGPLLRAEAGLPIRRDVRGVPKKALTADQIELIYALMAEFKIRYVVDLAHRLRERQQNVSKWLKRERGVSDAKRVALAHVFDLPWAAFADAAATLEQLRAAKRDPNGDVKVTLREIARRKTLAPEGFSRLQPGDRIEGPQGQPGGRGGEWTAERGDDRGRGRAGMRRPIYEVPGVGNPAAREERARPVAVDWAEFDADEQKVIGSNSFGLRVRDESMSTWELHPGDLVWIDPDQAPHYDHPVAVLVRRGGRDYYALRELKQGEGGPDYLVAAGADGPGEPVEVTGLTILGPAVRQDRKGALRRRDILTDQANLVDRLIRPIPLPDAAATLAPDAARRGGDDHLKRAG